MKQKFLKLAKEFTVVMTAAIIVLSFAASVQAASDSTENTQNSYLIAATNAGSTGGASPTTGAPKAGTTGATSPTTDPASRATDTGVTGDSTDTGAPDNLIPIKTTGYDDLWKLKSQDPVSMLNELKNGFFRNAKYIFGAVAVLFVMLAAVKLIVAGDNEEVVTKQKKAITYAIIALAVIGFSDEIAQTLSVACPEGEANCSKGGFLADPNAMIKQSSIFNNEVKIFITFIKYLIGGIAVLMLVRNGIRFVALYGNEESVTVDKKNLAFISAGLVLIVIASVAIEKVFFVVDKTRYSTSGGVQPAIAPERGVEEIAGITNMVVTFATPIAILVLIIAGVMYATAGGDEEKTKKAKRMIVLAVAGLALMFGAFAIVGTVISGQFSS
ncbi:pilin [Patescibacteria group bacterium]